MGTMDLYAMDSACREFPVRRERLVQVLKGAVVRIPEYLEKQSKPFNLPKPNLAICGG